jgi:NitT/TauT family transport system permease protein
MKKFLIHILSLCFIILGWQLAASIINNVYILPNLTVVMKALIELLLKTNTYTIIFLSILRLLSSILIAVSFGIILGLFAGIWLNLDVFLKPLVTILKTLPVASIIVVILIIFAKSTALYVITFLILFPIIYEATKQGVLTIDKQIIDSLKLEPKRLSILIKAMYLPLSFPYIKTSFLQSFGLGFKVLIMAEFISQADQSIGRALYNSSISIDYALVFAWTILIIVIAYIIDSLVNLVKTH